MKAFNRRYQEYPAVFVGTLQEALKESFKADKIEEVRE